MPPKTKKLVQQVKRRWRDYRTASGARPVHDFIMALPAADRAAVVAGMKDVQKNGMKGARHVEGDIYEVRVSCDRIAYRVFFAKEGNKGRVLLSLEAIKKKTQKTPKTAITTAESRLKDWRDRHRRRASKKKPHKKQV